MFDGSTSSFSGRLADEYESVPPGHIVRGRLTQFFSIGSLYLLTFPSFVVGEAIAALNLPCAAG